jgi:hypothetical protein
VFGCGLKIQFLGRAETALTNVFKGVFGLGLKMTPGFNTLAALTISEGDKR